MTGYSLPTTGSSVMAVVNKMDKQRVRRITAKQKAARLRVSVAASERKHGCSSADMVIALKSGHAHETRDVSQWLFNYRALGRLEGHAGHTTGIPGKIIRPSIGAT
jgi:hypothetical protein